MGRHRLPLACSKCKRTPKEVRILANRYCVDCMRQYNKIYYNQRHATAKQHEAQERLSHTPLNPKTGLPIDFREGAMKPEWEGLKSPDGNYVYTDGHWENAPDPAEDQNVLFDELFPK